MGWRYAYAAGAELWAGSPRWAVVCVQPRGRAEGECGDFAAEEPCQHGGRLQFAEAVLDFQFGPKSGIANGQTNL